MNDESFAAQLAKQRSGAARAMIVVAALLAPGCEKSGAGGPSGAAGGARKPLAFPVEVRSVEAKPVDFRIVAVGSVEAFEQVQVTSRVSGVVEKVHFSEGDRIKGGARLVEIEPRRFQIALNSAKAAVVRAGAQESEAKTALERRVEANTKSPGLVREDELAGARAKLEIAAAAAAEARAAHDLAELNLRDAQVRAPFDGTIETRNVRTGQYVQPGTLLATLVRRDPMLLRFSVREDEADQLATGMPSLFTVRGNPREWHARITHVAQAAESASRMVDVTAEVEDEDRAALRAGSFAEVRIPVGTKRDVPVVPETAIRPSERGFLAFVVEEGVARLRVLTLGLRTTDGDIEVRDGIQPGEVLVVRGAEALRDGVPVKVETRDDGGAPKGASPEARAKGASQ